MKLLSLLKSRSVFTPMMIGWAMLTLIPAILLISDTTLFPLLPLNSLSAEGLFWLTSSGTAPYGVATVLFILLLSYQRLGRAEFISLFLTISLGMCTTLGLNHYLKPFFNEARPNAVLLEQQYLLNTTNFYTLTKSERKAQMAASLERLEHAETDLVLSPLVKQHWKNEVGFAFPSGHTLFAVTLTMIASYYLLLAGNWVLPTILFIWSLAMGFSRMLLGMHWSQDVLASTLLGGVISLFSLFFIHKTFPYGAKLYTYLSVKLRQKQAVLRP